MARDREDFDPRTQSELDAAASWSEGGAGGGTSGAPNEFGAGSGRVADDATWRSGTGAGSVQSSGGADRRERSDTERSGSFYSRAEERRNRGRQRESSRGQERFGAAGHGPGPQGSAYGRGGWAEGGRSEEGYRGGAGQYGAQERGPYGRRDQYGGSSSSGRGESHRAADIPASPRDHGTDRGTGLGTPRTSVDREEADFGRDRAERFAGDRDASADLGLGYRDFGEGYGVRGAAGVPRRNRWQREPTTARDVMTRNPKVVVRTAGVVEIARIMREENTGVVPVVDERGALAGLVTDRDIVIRTLSEGRNPIEVRAEDVMTDDVEAVMPDESLRDVVDLMGDRQIRRVPVVDRDDRLVGIISMADVATRADFDEDLQDALEEISARRSFWSRLFG